MDIPVVSLVAEFSAPPVRGASGLVRDFIRKTLADWCYRGEHDDVVLVASELVTNALRHAAGAPVVRLAGDASRLRIEVVDGSPSMPEARPSGTTGGWGLTIVQRLTARWGAHPEAGGKVVWCEMSAEEDLLGTS